MKMFFNLNRVAVVLACLCTVALTASVVNAGAISPDFDTFGTLTGATFGGSGIANNAVAITTIDGGSGNTFKLGLTAHARFSEPVVTNDGAGTFSAAAGGFSSNPSLSRWNFAYYVEVVTGSANGCNRRSAA